MELATAEFINSKFEFLEFFFSNLKFLLSGSIQIIFELFTILLKYIALHPILAPQSTITFTLDLSTAYFSINSSNDL